MKVVKYSKNKQTNKQNKTRFFHLEYILTLRANKSLFLNTSNLTLSKLLILIMILESKSYKILNLKLLILY